MPYNVIVHMSGEEAVLGELPELPDPTATNLIVYKVRRRDGKPVHYLAPNVTTVIWPMDRLTFVEVVPPRDLQREAEARRLEAEAQAAAPPAPPVEAPVAEAPPPPEPVAPPPTVTPAPAAPRPGGLLSRRVEQAGQRRPE
jgi:hypothetical protein